MSKYIASIPLGDIDRIRIYINSGKLPLRQIVAQEEPDLAITGNFWLYETYRPTCPIKADGKVLATDAYHYPALIWDTGPDISMGIVPPGGACGKANYIANSAGLYQGKPETMYCKPDVRGRRGRTGWGMWGGALAFIAFPDGDGMEPEELRDYVQSLGWSDFIMGDGGRKVNYYNRATGDMVQGRDPSQNLILVYKRKRAPSEPDDSGSDGERMNDGADETCPGGWGEGCEVGEDDKEEKPMSEAYQVTPSVGVNIRSGPGTGYSKVGAYAQGTVVTVTATRDGWGQTEKGWVSLDYLEAVEAAQRVTDNGLRIQARYIDAGRKNRPGGVNPCGYITIHETGNAARGADAAAHGSYLNSAAGEAALVSWHYTVDDHAIVQHLPDGETAYHAGDGPKGTGNARSIGVEICVNADGDFAKARENAASLVRLLMEEHGIPIGHVVQHNHWNGKDCPYTIRHTSGAWEAFLALCEGGPCAKTNRQTVQARFGLADETMDYLEAYRYGADLLQKLAAAN